MSRTTFTRSDVERTADGYWYNTIHESGSTRTPLRIFVPRGYKPTDLTPQARKVPPHIIDEALAEAEPLMEIKRYDRNSIRSGEGIPGAYVAEKMTVRYFTGMKRTHDDTNPCYNHDVVHVPTGKTIEVKAKYARSLPGPNYWCSVCDRNTRQRPDYYAFWRIKKDGLSRAWFCGLIGYDEFWDKATFFAKGTEDPLDDNGFGNQKRGLPDSFHCVTVWECLHATRRSMQELGLFR